MADTESPPGVAQSVRQAVARRLHDETLGIAFAATLHLQSACPTDVLGDETAQVVLDRVEAIMSSLRDAIAELNCQAPAETRQTLAELVRDLNRSFPLEIRCQSQGDATTLPLDVASTILAITRESLTNVARHSSAQHALVSCIVGRDDIELVVDDDGVGFDEARIRPGCGLANIGQRASELGGTASVETSPTGGARIRVWIPTG